MQLFMIILHYPHLYQKHVSRKIYFNCLESMYNQLYERSTEYYFNLCILLHHISFYHQFSITLLELQLPILSRKALD